MKRSVVSGLSCSALVVCIAAVLGACSSSDATTDSSAVDVGKGDVVTVDGPGGPDVCAPNVPCEETCLDAKATEPPIFASTCTWDNSSNASFMTHLTPEARRCQWQSVNDNCIVYDCLSSEWTGAAAAIKGTSAGEVTIGNGSGQEVLIPDADGVYPIKYLSAPAWNAGDTITFTAEGATVPAFTLTIGVPTPVVATDPLAPDAGAKPAVDRSTPMTFSWTPTDEKVLVAFVQQPLAISPVWDRRELWCTFDGAAGTGTVPAAVLQHLKLGMGSTGYGIGHYNRRCYSIGGFHVQVSGVNGLWWNATVK
jgi:hypothetical protein